MQQKKAEDGGAERKQVGSYGRAFWENVVAEKHREGLTTEQVAKRHGVGQSTVSGWIRRLRRETQYWRPPGNPAKQAKVVEVLSSGQAQTSGGDYIITCGRFTLQVDGAFDEGTLRRLLQVVVSC